VAAVLALAAIAVAEATAPPAPARHAANQPAGRHAPNRLAKESSPYLLLHAENPVDWYPWGEEAIARARREDKPIFLSIGYSTCYWCHVMERETFSDEGIARSMNAWFVSIKVDREERPELDEVYMSAALLLTGSGGWPTSLFLTPDLEPFFAGTYFPPEDRHGMTGFASVLRSVHDAWLDRRPKVIAQAGRVAAAMRSARATDVDRSAGTPSARDTTAAVEALKAGYDARHGGFGGPPKFPQVARLWLLWAKAEDGDGEARQMVADTLRAMGRGAIHDQLGGGFHRYTLDAAWRIPHFEKMLYDNALLAELLAEVAHGTGDAELARIARGVLAFVLREMKLPEGGFASALDAETNGVEGAAYTWTRDALLASLGEDGFALLAPIYGFNGEPNLDDGSHTLFLTASLDDHARRFGISRVQLDSRLQPYLDQLRLVRGRRPRPMLDDKVLADWSGMMIAALARAGLLLGEPRYLGAARSAASFVLASMTGEDGVLRHTWRARRASIPAFLEDYAFLIRGLLALHAATAEARWLKEAERLAAEMHRRLAAPGGGYFQSAADPRLLVRVKPVTDGAIPSGNGVAALDLLWLGELTGKPLYRRHAEELLIAFASDLSSRPRATPTLAVAVLRAESRQEPGRAEAPAGSRRPPEGPKGWSEVVQIAARLSGAALSNGWQPFEVRLEIADGWHVNANPASLDHLVPTTVAGAVRNLAYPPGERLRLGFEAQPLAVYSRSATIHGELAPGAGRIRLTYQACNDHSCLPPVERDLAVQ
jgi:uncharacterized protein YyaL (SSP411 family)